MYLGIDYGTKNVGIAIGGPETGLALPYITLQNDKNFFSELLKICVDEKIEKIIIGIPMPTRPSSGAGEQVERAKKFARSVGEKTGLPVATVDEKFTTREVESYFSDFKKEMKKISKDAAAAAIILQSYLDKK
jgi:putative Holliday junction resolvase